MRVMCIATGEVNLPVWPEVGEVYTINRVVPESCLLWPPAKKGIIWWELCEFMGYCYNSEIFAPLSEIDETELANELADIDAGA